MKKYNGFTLVEVLVAMAILSIMTVMISICYSAVSTVNIQTQGLNEKMDLMSKYAEIGTELNTSVDNTRVNVNMSNMSVDAKCYGPYSSNEIGKGISKPLMHTYSSEINSMFDVKPYQIMSPKDSNGGYYAIDDDGTVWESPTTGDTVKGNYNFFTVDKP